MEEDGEEEQDKDGEEEQEEEEEDFGQPTSGLDLIERTISEPYQNHIRTISEPYIYHTISI